MNEKKLLKYAIDYLSKYDSSKKNLLYILKRKIFRLNLTGIEKKRLIDKLENILFELEKNKFIDDKRYTQSKISLLSRSGKSKNYIFNYLILKGIDKFEINNNFNIYNRSNNDWELNSAKIFAKKKKLIDSNKNYEKKLSQMARAGFSYDICKKILG